VPHNRVMEDRQAELDGRLRVIAQRAEFLRVQIAQLRKRRAEVLGAPQPGAELTAAQRRAFELQIDAGAIAAAIAATEDSLADTFDRMARLRPDSAARLQLMAARARRYAAKERREAERHRRTAADGQTAAAQPATHPRNERSGSVWPA
jgi:hypothetical protein